MPAHSGLGSHNYQEHEDAAIPLLDLFAKAPDGSPLYETRTQRYKPNTVLTNAGPYEWRFQTANNELFHPPFTRIDGAFKVTKKDGTALDGNDDVGIVNLAGDALFAAGSFEIGERKLEDTSFLYSWKAFLEKSLSQSTTAKNTHMLSELFYADTPGKMNVCEWGLSLIHI